MLAFRHCTALVAMLVGLATAAGAQPAPAPAPAEGASSLTIFLRNIEVGRMQSNVSRVASEWVISSTGNFGDIVLNRFETRYDAGWQPTQMRMEATQAGRQILINTAFGLTTAVTEITQNGATSSKTDQVSARTVALPNNVYAAYEALAVRLAASTSGAEIPIYVAPQAEVKLVVGAVTSETVQTPAGSIALRNFAISVQNPGATLDAVVAVDDRNRFARLEVPAAALTVVRSDLAGVAARRQTLRNPTDADVTIPVTGFNLAGTVTMPPGQGRMRHPVVVLVGAPGPGDRDESVAGIPVFAQLAGALAERGFMVLRYDKRGVGQSGGRTETVTLQDYADDATAVVKWLARRDDVDARRIAVAGQGQGGAVAMLSASRENKIAALVLMGAVGTTGAELILEQQRHQLDLMKLPEPERQQKIETQQKLQAAVVTEKGWEGLSEEVKRQADTPWFRSLLQFDPEKVMTRIKQPILIVQGDLDTQVPPHHAKRLADMARRRKNPPAVETVHLPGVNHLLVKATTGEAQEYATLQDKQISPDVAAAIAEWLRR